MKFKHSFSVACIILLVFFTNIRAQSFKMTFIDTLTKKGLEHIIMNTLKNRIEQYKIECHNDSSLHSFNIFIVNNDTLYGSADMIDPGIKQGWQGIEKIWIHKKPEFNDFIVWLQKH